MEGVRSSDIEIAVQMHSTHLIIKEETVGRIVPFVAPTQEQVDAKTIYIEHIESKETVDSVRQHCSPFGPVAIVRIPKSANGKMQGFGFVEFEDEKWVEGAVEGLNTWPLYQKECIEGLTVPPIRSNEPCWRVLSK